MKKFVGFFFTFLISVAALAQELPQDELGPPPVQWSTETKTYLLIAMTILTLFFTVRTFRNKPEA